MLSNEWKEKNSCKIVTLESVNVEDFKVFVEFLYEQSFKWMNSDHVWSVWNLCDYLEVLTSIKEKAIQVMVSSLNCQNAVKLLRIVNRTVLPELSITHVTPNVLPGKCSSLKIRSNSPLKIFLFMKLNLNY
jgi:hypothetical protein